MIWLPGELDELVARLEEVAGHGRAKIGLAERAWLCKKAADAIRELMRAANVSGEAK